MRNCEAVNMFSQVKGAIKRRVKSVMFARILKVHLTYLLALAMWYLITLSLRDNNLLYFPLVTAQIKKPTSLIDDGKRSTD